MGEKCKMLFFFFHYCIRIISKTRTQIVILLLHLAFCETSEPTSKRKFALGLNTRLTSGEIVNHFTVVTSYVMKCKCIA